MAMGLVACGAARGPVATETPAAAPVTAIAAAPIATPQERFAEMSGDWVATEDPTGVISLDPRYAGSRFAFTESTAHYHPETHEAILGGDAEVRSWGPGGGEITVLVYGEELTWYLDLRRDDGGRVAGFVLSETPERSPSTYFSRFW